MKNNAYKQFITFSIILLLFTVASCKKGNYRLDYALDFAGSNRVELLKVLKHYSKDSLKLEAARFLIENMPRYFSYTSPVLDSIKAIKASVDEDGKLPDEKVNPLKGFNYKHLPKIYDAHVITAEYLIENIDIAFEEWQKRPWNKHCTFDDFCELILPYRIEDEPLERWRANYRKKFAFLLDSPYTGSDVIEASNVIGQYLREKKFIFNRNLNLPHLGANFLLKYRIGKCVDSCDYLIYVLRSLGIPVTVDELPLSPDNLTGHTWNVVLDTTRRYIPFWFTEADAVRNDKYEDGRKKGKVFRKCFGMQSETFKGMIQDPKIPTLFKNPFKKDVSGEYFQTLHEVSSTDSSEKYMYIGIFTPKQWMAIDMTKISDGKAIFRNIEPGIAYQPLYYDGQRYRLAGYPFILQGDSTITFTPRKDEYESITVTRKCPLYLRIVKHMAKVVGAKIYSSNSENFNQKQLLYHITDTPKVSVNSVYFNPSVKCRYIRYIAPKDHFLEIADLDFYYKDRLISPQAISENKYDKQLSISKLHESLDHNPLTWIVSRQKGSYITIDFGKEIYIDRLNYTPRNDDNFIRVGDTYEIGYNKGYEGWKYIARQKAEKDTLVFDNIPKGALLHLRNLTRGNEEKVFYINNGKQTFP